MTPDFAAKARKLWKEGCTCGGIDIGAAYLHEHGCGVPTPDDVASALSSAYAAGAESRQGDMDQAGGRLATKEFALGETVSALDSAIRELTLIRGEVEKWMASATSALATEQAGGKP